MTENVKWNFIQVVQVGPFWFEEYLSEDEMFVKKIWYDGEIEIFKCGQNTRIFLSTFCHLDILALILKLQYNIVKK